MLSRVTSSVDLPDGLHHHGDAEVGDGLIDLAVNVRRQPMPAWLAGPIHTALTDLAFTPPPPADRKLTWKDFALGAVALAACILTLLPIALEYFGARWNADRELPTVERSRESRSVVATAKRDDAPEPQEAAV